MTQLFGRKIQVTFGTRSGTDTVIYYEDFNIDFNISRTIDGKTADSCNLKIHNINPGNIAEYTNAPDPFLRIAAGYEGNFGTIFDGDIIFTNTYMNGVDRITSIDAGDGDKAIDEVTINKSFAAEIKISDVIKDLVDTMKKNGKVIVDGVVSAMV